MKKLIEHYGINTEKDVVFNEILNLFQGKLNYQKWAVKTVYDYITNIDTIRFIKEWTVNNHQLISSLKKKNVLSYNTKDEIQHLLKEMQGLSNISYVKKTINLFNTNQRNMLKAYIFPMVTDENGNFDGTKAVSNKTEFSKWLRRLKNLEDLPSFRLKKLISTSSALTNISALQQHIDVAFLESYVWEKEDMLSFMKRNASDCKVVFENDSVVVATIPSFESSRLLCGSGRTGWCLTREESYFRRYTKEQDNAQQFFLFDFSKKEFHELAHIGFTVKPKTGIVNAHSTSNKNMLGKIEVDGKSVDIHTALEMAGVPKNAYITLNKLTNYEWNLKSFLEYASSMNISIVNIDQNRVIVDVTDYPSFFNIISHTLINNNIISGGTKKYLILDFNAKVNDENSIFYIEVKKDKYEVDSVYRIFNSYATPVDKNNLAKNNIDTTKFILRNKIANKVLLHKLIEEHNEEEAVRLVESDSDLDVNYAFAHRMPIFLAIDNNEFNVVKAIINHKNFNSSTQNSYGESFFQSLLYDYDNEIDATERIENLKKLINLVIESDNFDLNALNLNEDSGLNVACEFPRLSWVVEKLIANPKVNVNIINDINCSALTNAIRRKNIMAVSLLGTRPDLVVREEDFVEARANGIDLKEYIKPVPFKDGVTANNKVIKSKTNFAEMFKKALSFNN